MAKKCENNLSFNMSFLILIAYLVMWWLMITLIMSALNVSEDSVAYYLFNLLRIGGPILTAIFGLPVTIISTYNKSNKSKKVSKKK